MEKFYYYLFVGIMIVLALLYFINGKFYIEREPLSFISPEYLLYMDE